jgi:biopolymer transport protein ExbD
VSQGPGPANDRLEINLTPLLDLVLQLIMFFMLTVNFVRADQANESVDLPVVQSAMPLQSTGENLVYININREGQRLAGGALLQSMHELQAYISNRKADMDRVARYRKQTTPVDVVIVLRAHKDASWGDVYDTLDECSRAGYRSWQLRVIKQAM